MPNDRLVTAIFNNRIAAERAADTVLRMGYTQRDISLMMSDNTRTREFGIEKGNKAAEGVGVGSATGGTAGAVIAAIAAIGTTLAIPPLGLVVAGPIAAALAGAGAGGIAGGLIGGLVGAGIPEHVAKEYEKGLREGGILLMVEARDKDEAKRLRDALRGMGGHDVRDQASL